MGVYLKGQREPGEDSLGEPRVLEAATGEHHRQAPGRPARPLDQLDAGADERGVEARRHDRGRCTREDVGSERTPQRAQIDLGDRACRVEIERVRRRVRRGPAGGVVERERNLPLVARQPAAEGERARRVEGAPGAVRARGVEAGLEEAAHDGRCPARSRGTAGAARAARPGRRRRAPRARSATARGRRGRRRRARAGGTWRAARRCRARRGAAPRPRPCRPSRARCRPRRARARGRRGRARPSPRRRARGGAAPRRAGRRGRRRARGRSGSRIQRVEVAGDGLGVSARNASRRAMAASNAA